MVDMTEALSLVHPGLPGRDYHAEEVWELEKEQIFYRAWIAVARADEVSEPGDFVVRQVADEEILVVRGKDGAVRAFYNVCRHRGSLLCTEGHGTVKGAIVCPYHSWAYDLEGRLVGTPNVRAEHGLDRDAYGLHGLGCETWEGFVFVNLSDEPRSLLDQLAEEPDGPLEYARYGLAELRTARRITYEVDANWKIVLDNFNECLHCPGVHPELVNLVPMYRKGIVVDVEHPDRGATLDEGMCTFTMSGTSDLPTLPGLDDVDRRTYWGYSVMPSLMVNLLSTGVFVYTLFPRSAGHTTIVSEYLYRPETIASEGFDPSDMVEFLDLVSRQDWDVCERAQRGVRSRGFERGVYPPPDGLLHVFAERYLEMRGPIG